MLGAARVPVHPSGVGVSATADATQVQGEDSGYTTREAPPGWPFYFTRAVYSGSRSGWYSSWSVDFPKADSQFIIGVRRLTNIDAFELENPIRLDDPNLRRHPFLYALEVGYMSLSPSEVQGLRDNLLAGGGAELALGCSHSHPPFALHRYRSI